MTTRFSAAALTCYLIMTFCICITTQAFAHELKPGLYQIAVRVELPNLNDAATTLNKRICITEQMVETHDAFQVLMDTPLASCPRQPICMNGFDVGFHIACPGRSSAHANAKFKISSDQFTGTINMNMGGKNMTVIEHQSGQRIGNCPTNNGNP